MIDGKLKNCMRYASIHENSQSYECTSTSFNTSAEIECSEFIYATDEKNIQTEVQTICSDFINFGA